MPSSPSAKAATPDDRKKCLTPDTPNIVGTKETRSPDLYRVKRLACELLVIIAQVAFEHMYLTEVEATVGKTEKSFFRDTYRFVLSVEDRSLTGVQVKKLVQQATQEASDAAGERLMGLQPSTELEGGFAGLGEATVILALVHAVKAGAIAASVGASSAAGKMFFEEFLAPRLRKLNLLPSKFHPLPRGDGIRGSQKESRGHHGKDKGAAQQVR